MFWHERAGIFLKKVFQLVFTLFLLSVAVFYMARLAPGDPLRSYYGDSVERMTQSEKQAAQEKLGLNAPISVQYGTWIASAVQGNFGISFQYKQPVTAVIAGMWGNTLLLGGMSFLLTFLLALLLGVFCAMREDSLLDKIICKAGTILNSIPSFWVALLCILIFSVNLRWLPSGGAYDIGEPGSVVGRVRHLILPLLVMVLGHLWYYAYMVRNRLLEEIRQDYVLLARAKGLTRTQVIFRHCLRSMAPAYFSMMAVSVPHILGGTYIVEQVFSYPGLGTLCFESAKYHDYNLLMVLCLITGTLVVISNMVAQSVAGRIDPRVRRKREGSSCGSL